MAIRGPEQAAGIQAALRTATALDIYAANSAAVTKGRPVPSGPIRNTGPDSQRGVKPATQLSISAEANSIAKAVENNTNKMVVEGTGKGLRVPIIDKRG